MHNDSEVVAVFLTQHAFLLACIPVVIVWALA